MDILNQLFDLKKEHVLPDVYVKFIYCDRTDTPMVGGNLPVFNHMQVNQNNGSNRIILSPCFSFHGYYTSGGKELIKYEDDMNNIINESDKNDWLERENTLIFKGYTLHPHRKKIIKELEDKLRCCEFLLGKKNFSDFYSNPISKLTKYKYQLLMNGYGTKIGNESGSIRPKYMLAIGSICIYIHLGTVVKEWWMYFDNNPMIICKTVDQAVDKINFFEDNPDKALKHLKKQREFVTEYLSDKAVKLYWLNLLKTYKNNCDFEIPSVEGSEKLKQEELESVFRQF